MEKITKQNGFLLPAFWLIAWGLVALIPALHVLYPVMAIITSAAVVLTFLNRSVNYHSVNQPDGMHKDF